MQILTIMIQLDLQVNGIKIILKKKNMVDFTLYQIDSYQNIAKSKIKMDGIKVTPLKENFNEKGNIFHALKVSEPDFYNFGEAYFSSVKKDVVKGWKKHIEMKMNLVVIVGQIKIVVYDDIKNSFFEIGIIKK